MFETMLQHIGTHGLYGIAFGYLLGSIPFGLIFTRMAGLGDIRTVGSGNIGATNVLRTGNKKIAIATLLCDALKGTFAVLLAGLFGPQAMYGAALGAVLGHNFPVWLGFKGGKGVATTLGVIFGLNVYVGLLTALTWLGVAYASKISSLGALVALGLAPFYAACLGKMGLFYLLGMLAVIAWLRHHDNIRRLIRGEEAKINLSSTSISDDRPR
ncbi:MAG: glycerol-3-phosphate 1-O-acyltransferase PlsY [Pseudomonadota bacterium]